MNDVNWTQLVIFTVLFALVSGLGFVASRWRRAKTLDHLDEWGLGGRNFGSWISWFLIGGGLYTAYTFVAVARPGVGGRALRVFARPPHLPLFPLAVLRAPPAWAP